MTDQAYSLTTEELVAAARELIAARDWFALRAELARYEPAEIAEALRELDDTDSALAFRLLPRERSSEVIAEMESADQRRILEGLTEQHTRRLLTVLDPDDRTALLEELPGEAAQRLLNLLSGEDLAEARLLLGYPEESVGRLMTPDYVAIRKNWTVERALEHIRRTGTESETINVVYVTDAAWRLLDALDLKRLILAAPDALVADLMDDTYVSISAFEDREEGVNMMQRYNLFALPVVNTDGALIGIVTIDDVLDVVQEEATEDFHRIAGVAPLERSYGFSSVLDLYRKRIGWLSVLIVVNIASSGVIEVYEEVLAATIALAFFVPLLIGSGGNAGAQAATIMVRAIATGDVQMRQWFRIVFREVRVGFALGATMGLLAAVLGIWRGGVEVGIVVGMSMVSIVLVANLMGTILPFVLTKVRLDPAAASAPLITTVADVTGLMIYFSIALLLLGT